MSHYAIIVEDQRVVIQYWTGSDESLKQHIYEIYGEKALIKPVQHEDIPNAPTDVLRWDDQKPGVVIDQIAWDQLQLEKQREETLQELSALDIKYLRADEQLMLAKTVEEENSAKDLKLDIIKRKCELREML